MKAYNLVFAISFGFLYSCNTNQEFKATDKDISTLVPLLVTVVANLPDSLQPKTYILEDLPDSLQPKTYLFEDMPKSWVRAVPNTNGETFMLPVLKNEKGEPILDQEGNTILMGEGGVSNFTTFTTDDGLALNWIYCSIMDKYGNLWFGTNGGISRYDGKSFTNFTTAHGLASNIVLSMTEDKAGNLWFGTAGGGVNRYDGISITNFKTDQGLANYSVWSIIEDKKGDLWFGTNGGGVSRYDGKSFTNYTTADGLADNVVWCIFEDNAGYLWFGTGGGGVSRYDPSELHRTDSVSRITEQIFKNFTMAQGLASDAVSSINEDKTGNLWFGTYGRGVSRYDGQSFTNFTTANGLANNTVRNIVNDRFGNLWFCTEGGGVSNYNGKTFINYTAAQGLPNNDVWNMVEDKSGSLWFGTLFGGISRLENKSFIKFTTTHGLNIESIIEDEQGNIWFGTYDGEVNIFDGKSFTNFNTTHGLPNVSVWSIAEDVTGTLWFGALWSGVFRLDGKSFTRFTTTQGLTSNHVQCITEDKNGNLWFGTEDSGISKFDGKSFTNFTIVQGLTSNNIRCITEDKMGNLWFGSFDGGVSLFDGKSFINFTTDHGLVDDFVYSIKEDKSGNIWFGTDKGLSFLALKSYQELFQEKENSGDSDTQPIPNDLMDQISNPGIERITSNSSISSTFFRSFGLNDGFPDNVVKQVVQMPNGKMAVGTNKGITLFNISEDYTKLTDLEIYHSTTGYPVNDVLRILVDSKGIMWAGTGSVKTGLIRFDYEALNRSEEPPALVIQSLKVNNENISWHTLSQSFDSVGEKISNPIKEKSNSEDSITTHAYITEEVSMFRRELSSAERDSMKQKFGKIKFNGVRPFYPLPENLILPYNLNQVSFEFVAIETSRPQMIKYQYLLEGYDEDWSPVTERSNATFGNIHEGTYTFKLKALGANGIWTEPVIYNFKVLPPWHRTWWAHGIYILLLGAIVWIIHLIQKARTIRIEREKTKDKELAQAKEIEKAYGELGKAHETLKSTQSQLIHSEKMASLGELTAGIAHEIQNPLNFVNNFSELSNELLVELKEEIENGNNNEVKALAEDVIQNLHKINHHGKRADAIVKGMLQHSRTSNGVKEPTNINALADEYLRLSYHGLRAKNKSFNADFITEFDPNLPRVNVIPQDIGRVLLNLINNAFYAVDKKAKENISGYKPKIVVSTKQQNGNIEIKVRDNGPGIPAEIKDKIFQPFFTTKPTGQGTGLGLSLSYDIVKAHGGELKVETEKEKGSEFIIIIPISKNPGI